MAAGPYYETITMTRRAGKLDATESKLHFAVVYGIDGRKEQRINRFREYLHRKDPATKEMRPTVRDLDRPFDVDPKVYPADHASGTVGVIVGSGLQRELRVEIGRKIRMTTVHTKVDPDKPDDAEPDVDFTYRQVLVVGVYQSGNSEVDAHCVFMDHEAFRRLFKEDVSRISVRAKLRDPDEFEAAGRVLHTKLDGVIERSKVPGAQLAPLQRQMNISSWKLENRPLVQAIESEKAMILVIAFLIVVAGTSSIFAAQWLLVSDKVREIGILRALGARFGGVTSIFILNGFLMGLLGSVGGTAVGLLVVNQIDRVHSLVSTVTGRAVFDPTIYLFERIPTLVDYPQVMQYASAALVCTLVAAAVPAIRAGFMNPAEALHHE